MGRLTSARRKRLPKSEFAQPNDDKYPIYDKTHAILAKSYAKQERNKGKLSQGAYRQIVTKANKKIKNGN